MKKGKNLRGIIPLFLAGSMLASCAPISLTPSISAYTSQPRIASLEQAVVNHWENGNLIPLHEKAAHFLEQIEDRHITPEGLLAYSVRINESKPGQPFVHSADDMACFTGLYLAAESFRYGATKDPGALENVKRTVHALRDLQEVTGVEGLFARYYGKPENTKESEFKKFAHKPYVYKGEGRFRGYKWLGEISNDQLAGIYFGYAAAFDFVDDKEVRRMVAEDVTKVTDHMIRNNMRFRDADGDYTKYTNMNSGGVIDFNKMLALSFLKTAHHITGNELYEANYNERIRKYRYHQRMRVLKPALITKDMDLENHFNDNVIFLGLFNLLRYEDDEKLLGGYQKATHLLWFKYTRGEANSFFNIMYNVIMPPNEYKQESFEEALASLVLMPTEKRDIRVRNSGREDVCKRKVMDTELKREWRACHPLPINDRPIADFVWARDPYKLDSGSKNPYKEYTGVDFLLPYWMARYYGFVNESM